MKNKKLIICAAIFAFLAIFTACDFLLRTDDLQNEEISTELVFVGKNKTLGNANLQFVGTNGEKIAEKKLDENAKIATIPAEQIYLKITQKETDDEL